MRKNINRTTVIIVLAIFLTLSVGYALFSDTITIEGTATAQGKFDMEVSCQPGMLSGLNSEDFLGKKEEGYKNDSCLVSDDKNTATFNVELTYPGAGRAFTVKISNKGTIDAMVDLDTIGYYRIESCRDGYKNGNSTLEQNGLIEEHECAASFSGTIIITELNIYAIEESDGSIIYASDENVSYVVEKYILSKDDKVYLNVPPNESVYFAFHVGLHTGYNGGLERYKFGYTFDFQQSVK